VPGLGEGLLVLPEPLDLGEDAGSHLPRGRGSLPRLPQGGGQVVTRLPAIDLGIVPCRCPGLPEDGVFAVDVLQLRHGVAPSCLG
jgi:hypothetical protein